MKPILNIRDVDSLIIATTGFDPKRKDYYNHHK